MRIKKKKEKEKEKSKKEKNRFDLSHMRYASIRDPLKHQPRLKIAEKWDELAFALWSLTV